MLTSLHGKLFGVVFASVVAFAALTLTLNLVATRAFIDEVNQKVALMLAERIATEERLFVDGRLDAAAVDALFAAAMTINPLAEMYLLNPDGRIVASSVPDGRIRRRTVDLAPVRAILTGTPPPVRGDDPRDNTGQKVFSVAALPAGTPTPRASGQGYLYIILGGEQFDSVVRMLLGSQILRYGAWGMAVSLLCALMASGLGVRILTRPLRRLTEMVEGFESGEYRPGQMVPGMARRWPDEVDRLTGRFDAMAGELESYVNKLKRADAQRRDLVANVSHDLKTPLSAVQGYLDTLLIKGATLAESERRTFIELALGQGKRADRLVSELLELSRLESGELTLSQESTSICDLVQDVVQKFQHAAGEHQVVLRASFDPDLPLLTIDVRLIERLLDNLVENALRHTKPRDTILLSCRASNAGLTVKVEDTGEGIHPDDLPYVFERFYRGRSATEAIDGAGLGLAIARHIAEAHRATLVVESDGQGTRFTLTFPC